MAYFKNHTDIELVILLREGEEDAFDEIYRRYWKSLFQEARKRLGESEYAEEVVQDVFIDLWVNRSTREINQLYAYLQTAVRYQVFMLYKKHKKLPFFEEPLEHMGFSDDKADSPFCLNELLAGIEVWLAHQPVKRREIFRLRYLEQLSTKEIAEELFIAQKTVQNQLINGQESFRAAVSKLLTFTGLLITQLD